MTVAGPDRGYSWVIVFCCSYLHFALFGLFRSWGVIFVAVLEDYNVSREDASWPFNLCSAVFQLFGPVVSIITHYISKRATCLIGSTIATIGIVGCYFAKNVMWITIFYGVVHGLGFGMVVTLIPTFVNQYFVKHRATAIGIAFSGGSISSFVVPIAMEWLLENYSLRGSFLLLGGLVMNTLVASALLRPPPWLRKSKKMPKLLEDSEAKDSGVSTSGDALNENKEHIAPDGCFSPFESEIHEELHDSVFIESNLQDNENDESSTVDTSNLEPSTLEEGASIKQDTLVSNNDSILFGGSVSKVYTCTDSSSSYKNSKDCTNEVQEPLMKENRTCIVPKDKNIRNNKTRNIKWAAFHSIIEILRNPMFHLIAYTMVIFFVALQSFFMVIVDYTKDKGIPHTEGVYLISIFSLTDIVGRSGLGWITDRNYVKRKNMVIFNLTVISIILQLYPLINDLTGLLVVAAFHGIVTGSCLTLFFVLQAEYLGIKRLTLVVGLTSFINGSLSLLRPAMIGLFRDELKSYDWMFHSLGIASFAVAIIWLVESWMTKETKSSIKNSIEKA